MLEWVLLALVIAMAAAIHMLGTIADTLLEATKLLLDLDDDESEVVDGD